MKTTLGPLAASLLAVSTVSCLDSDVEHDIVLDPDGSAVWSVLERHVVSDESDPAKRDAEERIYRERLLAGDPPVAEALRALGGWNVNVHVLRDERPFAVEASARFARVDRMLEEYLDRADPGTRAEVVLDDDGARTTLRIVLHEGGDDDAESDPAVGALQVAGDNLTFLLTRGRFVEAVGFRIDDAHARAALAFEEAPVADGVGRILSLSWEAAR